MSDTEYRQRIRRYRPSDLLPLIAAKAAEYAHPDHPGGWLASPYKKYTPWALADAARVSVIYGNEYRDTRPGDDDLLKILDLYSSLDEPFARSVNPSADLLDFLLRMSGEQLVWQEPQFNDQARTAALFLHTQTTKAMQCMHAGWDTALFGCSLVDYVGITQLLWSMVVNNRGWFDPDGLPHENRDTVDASIAPYLAGFVGRSTTMKVIDAHFAASTTALRAEDARVNRKSRATSGYDRQLRRFEYNPLRARPAITGLGTGYLCPSPGLVWAKATPWGLTLSGMEHFGLKFPRDLGHLFGAYVGRQLGLLADATVLAEITYAGPDGPCESTDWIVVFDDLVLLIEVKAMMPTQPMRLGGQAAVADIAAKLTKAHEQIDSTSARIAAKDPAFSQVPSDRPVLGMVVTLQPFHIANIPDHKALFPNISTTVRIASAADLEMLVVLDDEPVSTFLADLAADPERSTWGLLAALRGHKRRRNPILDQGWASYPWPRSEPDTDDAEAASG